MCGVWGNISMGWTLEVLASTAYANDGKPNHQDAAFRQSKMIFNPSARADHGDPNNIQARRQIHSAPRRFSSSPECSWPWEAVLQFAGLTSKPAEIDGDLQWQHLRRECGSRLAQKGVDVLKIEELVGHASITTTQRVDVIVV